MTKLNPNSAYAMILAKNPELQAKFERQKKALRSSREETKNMRKAMNNGYRYEDGRFNKKANNDGQGECEE